MDAPDMRSSRFTIINDDVVIEVSKSLLDKLSKKPSEQQQQQQQQPTAVPVSGVPMPPLPTPTVVAAKAATEQPKVTPNVVSPEEERARYADSTSPEQSKSDASYGDTIAILRDAYENKLEQQGRQWRSRMKKVEELNERLLKLNSAKLANEIDLVQTHFGKQVAYSESPCFTAENELMQCYSLNGKKSLLCAEQVKAFVECVRLAGLEYLYNCSKKTSS